MNDKERNGLRTLIRSYYSIQNLRMSSANQLELKKDGTSQNKSIKSKSRSFDANETLMEVYKNTKDSESKLAKAIQRCVEQTEEWNLFLKNIKGCGPILAAVLITEIDIRKANTVSSIWQYAGMNPAKNVKGRKYIDGKIIITDDNIKGDKPTKGYLIPYNKELKKAILGKLGPSFIKTNSPYRKFYDDYKVRLENSDAIATSVNKPWKDTTKMHRNAAANRHMCQQFLIDYYRAVHTIYGLEVRVPYSEEYLGKMHHTKYAELPNQSKKVEYAEDLGLSTRALNVLSIYYSQNSSEILIEKLRSIDLNSLKLTVGCGKKTYEEIVTKLKEYGIK